MIENLIYKETVKFYRYLAMYMLLISIVWSLNYFVSELIPISLIATLFIIYKLLSRIPNYMFWKEIKSEFKSGRLEDFINNKYGSQKELLDNNRNQTKTVNIMNPKYNALRSVNDKSNNGNRMKKILQLKRLIESEENRN